MYKGLGYLGSMVVLNPVGLSLLLLQTLYVVVPLPLLELLTGRIPLRSSLQNYVPFLFSELKS